MSKLLLVDGHSILNRAYYGLPDMTSPDGRHTNAVLGFINIIHKVLSEESPDYFAVAFDVHAPTFRHKMYAEYKGTRSPMAPELKEQVPLMKEMLHAMGVPTIELEGYEADDVLGTLSLNAQEQGMAVTVLSGDRDLLQLASETTKISIPKTKQGQTTVEEYYAKDVLEQKQVTPEEFIDVKALMGDSSDNIPGVPGIGEKTATAIIVTYHSIENAHDHVDELKPPKASKNLAEFYDQAVMSKTLATIDRHAPVELDMDSAKAHDIYTAAAYSLCRELGFKKILSRFDENAINTSGSAEGDISDGGESKTYKKAIDEAVDHIQTASTADEIDNVLKWGSAVQSDESATLGISVYVSDGAGIISSEKNGGQLQFAMETSQKSGLIALSDGKEVRVLSASDCSDKDLERLQDTLFGNDLHGHVAALDLKGVMTAMTGLSGKVIDVDPRGYERYDDLSVAAYLLDPLVSDYTADDIARCAYDAIIPTEADIMGKMSRDKAFAEKKDALIKLLSYEAAVAALSFDRLSALMDAGGFIKLYTDIERPLIFVLYAMERDGIGIDRKALREYGEGLTGSIEDLEKRIYAAAGEEFNINSPKQLGEILFEKLGLSGGKKTKTGYSTAADVLEKLAPENPIVSDILSYRQLAKLKSTYADGLDKCIDSDGRIRTTFCQTVTATGRLSSTEPNLQNIPIRMEQGKLIRKVFFPREGYTFVDADYSQIELRVLAHMSGDENLIEAYRQDKDIHRATAAQVFHVPFDEVTELQRRNAKAVNFGIVYGISSFGLGQDLNISRKEAQEYIDNYYAAYPKLKSFIDALVKSAHDTGEARTLYGRHRKITELNSSNFMQRQFGERVAMNMPIQGTAADIIKIAMIRVYNRLRAEGLKSRLILQVHDELLIEAADDEVGEVYSILDEEMRAAADLAVPLEVDVHDGKNWYDAK